MQLDKFLVSPPQDRVSGFVLSNPDRKNDFRVCTYKPSEKKWFQGLLATDSKGLGE
jgi:hypothetical protein